MQLLYSQLALLSVYMLFLILSRQVLHFFPQLCQQTIVVLLLVKCFETCDKLMPILQKKKKDWVYNVGIQEPRPNSLRVKRILLLFIHLTYNPLYIYFNTIYDLGLLLVAFYNKGTLINMY